MPLFDTVVSGGLVVTAGDRVHCDIGIRGGKVVALGHELEGREMIDATGKLVLPGGVDSHVHIAQPSGNGIVMADDFETGTRSAAFGGTTTVMPFCLQEKDVPLRETLRAYHAKAEGQSYVDVSFHLIINQPNEQLLGQDLPALVEDGYTSFKIFMTYDDLKLNDRQILDVMSVARETGALVMVHAENYDAIRFMTEELEKAGKTAPRYHATSRPKVVEREATHRAISLAELVDVPVMIVHVSNREAMEQIRWAQQRGLRVFGETCTQYLVLTEDDLDGLGMEGAKYVCSPPPRDVESQEACWEGLRSGVFSVFSSDHCPYRYDDEQGKLNPRGRSSFRWVPNGIPGIGARLPILFSEGVSKGRMSLEQFVAVTAANPAKTYGLYPRKGTIAVGSDADIVVWDPTKRVVLRHEMLQDGADYTPYEGAELTGWPTLTLVRGTKVVENGELVGRKDFGAYLPRNRSPFASPASRVDL
ncbi:dihydropyrimidinase [Ancylobacter sp. 3268]|uniref:dihydropyrimidinase n=1 Tax=Ancylobacter sp. 3268 TaxID=2817752 RepID=UPI00286C908E|nr:dihydropyrimidinase [Ancylobacter sp. 3268]